MKHLLEDNFRGKSQEAKRVFKMLLDPRFSNYFERGNTAHYKGGGMMFLQQEDPKIDEEPRAGTAVNCYLHERNKTT